MKRRGKMTRPGEIVANFGKNWRMSMAKKKLHTWPDVSKYGATKIVQHVHICNTAKLFEEIAGEER